MRTPILFLILLLTLAGCSPTPPQEAVAGGANDYFAYQVSGSWENKGGEWYEKRKLRMRVFEGRVDPRTRMAEKMATALQVLDTSGPYSTSQFLYRLHPIQFNQVPPDQAQLDTLWKQVESARKLLPGTVKAKPDPARVDSARALLRKTQQDYAQLDGDLQSRARRFGNLVTASPYDFTKAQSTSVIVDGHPALFLITESSGGRQDSGYIGLLVFEAKQGLAGLALYSEKPIEASEGEMLASSIRLGVERPLKPSQKKERAKPLTQRLPRGVLYGLIVLLAASLPAAFGAASGYGPKGRGIERAASAGAGAFFFTGVGMFLGICILFILALNGISNAPTSGGGLMVGVGLLIFLGFYGTAAAVSWLLTCCMASLGAKMGARQGRFTASLGAGVLAGLGALLIPACLGWIR